MCETITNSKTSETIEVSMTDEQALLALGNTLPEWMRFWLHKLANEKLTAADMNEANEFIVSYFLFA